MIHITIEMWPGGDKTKSKLLGEGYITNQGGTREVASYYVQLLKSPEYAKPGNEGQLWKDGNVSGFPRQRLGPWDLLLRSLLASVGYRS